MKTSNAHFQLSDQALSNQQIKLPRLSVFKRVLQLCVEFLMNDQEPQIWTTTDRDGTIYWHAHDPVSDRSVRLNSEAEMRAWLEQRYYN